MYLPAAAPSGRAIEAKHGATHGEQRPPPGSAAGTAHYNSLIGAILVTKAWRSKAGDLLSPGAVLRGPILRLARAGGKTAPKQAAVCFTGAGKRADSGYQHRGAQRLSAFDHLVRPHRVLSCVFAIDIGVENAVTDRLVQVSRGPFEIGSLGDIVHDRGTIHQERWTGASSRKN